jgi:predicted exporter
MHSVSNEDVIKKDIQRTVTIAMIAFLTVFLLTFKDLRALIFLIIPVGAVILALNLSAFVFGKLSYFIIGLGAVIIGVADDYGIHTYVAVHTSGKKDAVKEIAKPLFIAALTTISVFITFFFSSVQGYHQLAFFSIVSILFCLFFVLFVFPHFLKTPEMPDREVSHGRVGKPIISDSTRILLWIITTVFLLSVSFNSKFSSDISDLDGSSKSVISSEERFKHIFSRKDEPAMLIVFAKAQEDALKRNEQIYSEASSFIGEKNIVSFTNIWPSLKTREENVLAWKRFWDIEREKKLKSLLNKYSAKYDFSKDAFNPFFQSLHSGLDTRESPDDLEIFKGIKDRFVQHDESLWEIISFFPDRDDLVKPILRLSRNNPDTLVVSRKAFSEAISRGVTREMLFLSLIAGALVIVLTVALLKDLKLTLISLASVFTAIISITGLFALLNKPLNVAVIISSMMVIGLCIDYGVFMLYSFKHELNTGTVKAIWVSALTTLIGAFSLLFAKHPVLFSVGLTLVAGLSSGYLTSQTVIPALYRMLIKEDNAR